MSKDTAMEDFTLAELRRATQAAREFTVPIGPVGEGRSVNLRLPTEHELKVAGYRAGLGAVPDAAAVPVLQRALLCAGVVEWSNITQADVLATSPAEPLPLRPMAVEMLLDAHPDWEVALAAEMSERLRKRQQTKAEAEKNS